MGKEVVPELITTFTAEPDNICSQSDLLSLCFADYRGNLKTNSCPCTRRQVRRAQREESREPWLTYAAVMTYVHVHRAPTRTRQVRRTSAYVYPHSEGVRRRLFHSADPGSGESRKYEEGVTLPMSFFLQSLLFLLSAEMDLHCV